MWHQHDYGETAKGVCVATSWEERNQPKTLTLAVVRRKFKCRFGLCHVNHLVTFHFSREGGTTDDGAFCWTSRPARFRMMRLLKYHNNDSVQVRIKWRHGWCSSISGPKFVPMHTLCDQLVTKELLKETFVVRVHFGNGRMEERTRWQDISDEECEQLHQHKVPLPSAMEQEDAEGTVHEVCCAEEIQAEESSEGEVFDVAKDIESAEQKGKSEQKEEGKSNATVQEGGQQPAVGGARKATARCSLSAALAVLVGVVVWEVVAYVLPSVE